MKKILFLLFLLLPSFAFANTTYTFSWSEVKAPFFDSLILWGPYDDLNIWYDSSYIDHQGFLTQICDLYQFSYWFSGTLLPSLHSSSQSDTSPIDAYIYDSSGFTFWSSDYELLTIDCVTDYTDSSTSTGSLFFDELEYSGSLTNDLLLQILYILTVYVFFNLVWIFYSFINDFLWKR